MNACRVSDEACNFLLKLIVVAVLDCAFFLSASWADKSRSKNTMTGSMLIQAETQTKNIRVRLIIYEMYIVNRKWSEFVLWKPFRDKSYLRPPHQINSERMIGEHCQVYNSQFPSLSRSQCARLIIAIVQTTWIGFCAIGRIHETVADIRNN